MSEDPLRALVERKLKEMGYNPDEFPEHVLDELVEKIFGVKRKRHLTLIKGGKG